MAVGVQGGPVFLGMAQDEDGYREYKVRYQVIATNGEGPYAAAFAAGLPQSGDTWALYMAKPSLGGALDADPAAVCKKKFDLSCPGIDDTKPDAVKPGRDLVYRIVKYFSTRPANRCAEEDADDPLSQAPRVAFRTTKRTEEGLRDKNDRPIYNSAWELLRGAQNEWDVSDFQVTVTQNVADPQLTILAAMRDTVNGTEMWGFPARTIKLDDFSGEEKYYSKLIAGTHYDPCAKYYQRQLTFSIRFRYVDGPLFGTGSVPGEYETWDRYLLDEATKVLKGKWDTDPGSPTYKQWVLEGSPDKTNPRDFIRAVDFYGNPTKFILDGDGRPYDANNVSTGTFDDEPGRIFVQYYGESNFFLLTGLPASIGP